MFLINCSFIALGGEVSNLSGAQCHINTIVRNLTSFACSKRRKSFLAHSQGHSKHS